MPIRPDPRLSPVYSLKVLTAFVDKLAAFEAADGSGWARRFLLAADNTENGVDFPGQSGAVAALLGPSFAPERIDLTGGSAAPQRSQLLADFLRDGQTLLPQ